MKQKISKHAAESIPSNVIKSTAKEQATQIKNIGTGSDLISFNISKKSWIEVYDANKKRIYMDAAKAGEKINLSGTAPFSVILGYSPGVKVTLNGKPFNQEPYTSDGIARFIIGEEKKIQNTEAEKLALEKEVRKKQEEEKLKKEETINDLLSQAEKDINALRLTSPTDNNALEKIKRVLELSPDHQEAKQGLQNIVEKYIGLAQQAVNNGDYDRANANLDKAATILPDEEKIISTREAIDLKRQEEEEKRLAELEKKKKEDEQKQAEEEKRKLDEEIRIALLADGIDLSELPPVQQEAYISGKRREILAIKTSDEQSRYIRELTDKSSCLKQHSLEWKKVKNFYLRKETDGYELYTIIQNKCSENVWAKYKVYIEFKTSRRGTTHSTYYGDINLENNKSIEIKITPDPVMWAGNPNTSAKIEFNTFVIPTDQYKSFLSEFENLPFKSL